MHVLPAHSGKAAGALVAVAATAVGVAVALGAGYSVGHAALSDSSAYVTKGDAVAYVNGESRTTDGTSKPVAAAGDSITVIRLPDGDAAAIDNKTHKMTVIDGATLTPTATVAAKGGSTPVRVVTSGSGGWVVDHDGSTVTNIDGSVPGHAVHLPAAPVDAAPGPNGSVTVLGSNGQLWQVDPNGSQHSISTPATPGGSGSLTEAGGHTYLVTGSGAVVRVDSAPTTIASVVGVAPGPSGRMVVGSLQGSGPHVLILSGDTLVLVDPASGRSEMVPLHTGPDVLAQPVEFGNDVYVPDFTAHDVVRVDEASQAVTGKLAVPGDASSFALFVSGGMLWANDQYAEHLLVVSSNGSQHTVGKGPGDGVHDPKPTHPTPPTHRQTRPTPTPRPSQPTGPPPTTVPTTAPPPVVTPPPVTPPPVTPPVTTPPPAPTPPPVTIPRFPAGTAYQDACNQLQALGLTCTAVAAAGTDHDGNTGSVIATTPPAGAHVALGSGVVVSYIGQASVPGLPSGGTTPDQQCKLIVAARLTCKPEPSPTPGTSEAQYGLVSALSPAAGQPIDRGAAVTVYYYDSFPMPDVTTSHEMGTVACQQIMSATLDLPTGVVHPVCTSAAGTTPTNVAADAGKVYAQQPAPATPVRASDPVKLTTWPGTNQLPDWPKVRDGQGLYLPPDQVQQACLQAGFSGCTIAQGDSPGPPLLPTVEPQNAGRFEKTVPAPGTYPPGTPVTIYVWSDSPAGGVPNVVGQPIAQACAAITAAGLVCDSSQHPLNPSVGTALSETPPAGTAAQFGTAVVVPNANIQPTLYRQYTNVNNIADNNVIAQNGSDVTINGSDYHIARQHFYAYRADQIDVQGGTDIHHWKCTNDKQCHGMSLYLPVNVSPNMPGYADQGALFELMNGAGQSCTAPGQTGVWQIKGPADTQFREWVETGNTAPSGAWAFLGCGWSAP